MVDTVPQSLDDQLSSLRAELKAWEHAFAEKNGGRKADRQDIKRDGEIAAKYKTYSRLRASTEKTAGEDDATEHGDKNKDTTRGKKRKSSSQNYAFATPRKNSKYSFSTPSKRHQEGTDSTLEHEQGQKPPPHPSQLDPYDSPSRVRTLYTPSQRQNRVSSVSPVQLRSAIGPTPQRDGKVLGLFDLLSASGKSGAAAATPSRSARKRKFADVETPSRSKGVKPQEKEGGHDDDGDTLPYTPSMQRSANRALRTRRHSLTPVSTGKKFYLSKFFATPTVTRFAPIPEEEKEEGANATPRGNQNKNVRATPSKENKPALETPSFLRRRSLFSSGRAGQNDGAKANGHLSPSAVRMPPRVIGKGLSTLVKGLREIEDQQMDDDMDVLREIEAEQANKEKGDNVHVEDSQFPQGPAQGYEGYGGDAGEASPSQSRKPWKKPSQKRTTKLVTMRPSRAKPKPQPEWEDVTDGESEDEPAPPAAPDTRDPGSRNGGSGKADDEEDGNETQDADFNDGNDRNDDDDIDEEYTAGNSLFHAISKSRKQRQNAAKERKETEKKASAENSKVKTRGGPKKVKADAHANYRALKIKSRGSSGAGGRGKFGGRFGGRFRGRR